MDGDEYTYHRILNGVPEGVNEIIPMQSFPMESNLDIMGGGTHLRFLASQLTHVSHSRLPQGLLCRPGAHCANVSHGPHTQTHPSRPSLVSVKPKFFATSC